MEVGTQLRCICTVVTGDAVNKKTGKPFTWKGLEVRIGDYKINQKIFLNPDIEYIIENEVKKVTK